MLLALFNIYIKPLQHNPLNAEFKNGLPILNFD